VERTSPAEREATRRSGAELYAIGVAIAALVALIVFLANTTWYQVFLTLHIMASVIWVGGGIVLIVAALLAERARDWQQAMTIGGIAEWAGMRVFTPAAFVVLAFGFALVQKGHWGYDHFWVLFALFGWAFSAAVGMFVLTPWVAKLNELAAELGPEHPRTQERLRAVLNVARADGVILLLIVADMAAKPFFT
jgi:Predicted integral membrane protein (DUF2269)